MRPCVLEIRTPEQEVEQETLPAQFRALPRVAASQTCSGPRSSRQDLPKVKVDKGLHMG